MDIIMILLDVEDHDADVWCAPEGELERLEARLIDSIFPAPLMVVMIYLDCSGNPNFECCNLHCLL
jgi:hypothetical protein